MDKWQDAFDRMWERCKGLSSGAAWLAVAAAIFVGCAMIAEAIRDSRPKIHKGLKDHRKG
jgi:uncharacterized protein YoaH (UPF0181 family)